MLMTAIVIHYHAFQSIPLWNDFIHRLLCLCLLYLNAFQTDSYILTGYRIAIAIWSRWSFAVATINCDSLENIHGWTAVLYGQSLLHKLFHWKSFMVTNWSVKTAKLFYLKWFTAYSILILWLDLRKPGFHAHNSKTHFSPLHDNCTH